MKHDVLVLRKCPVNWKQRQDLSIAIDLVVKHQINKSTKINRKRCGLRQIFWLSLICRALSPSTALVMS